MIDVITIKNQILKLIAPILFKTKDLKDKFIESVPEYEVNSEDIKYLIYSTFNVIKVDSKDLKGYFRECRLHDYPLRYISNLLDDYFNYVNPNECSDKIKKEILEGLKDKRNLKKFMGMGVKNDPNSSIAKFYNNANDVSIVGINKTHSKELDSELSTLLQFVWGEVYLYNMCKYNNHYQYQTFNSNRQIATTILARLLGSSEIIPNTRYVKLKLDGKNVKFGTFMNDAGGVEPEALSDIERGKMSPNLQCEFMKLNVLDILCRHTDHRPGHDGNYNVLYNENNEIFSVCAFDNDAPTSFILSDKINFGTSAKTTPIINKKGFITRPYMSIEGYENLKNLSKQKLIKELELYLTKKQINYIYKRKKNLQKSIKKSFETNKIKLLSNNQWTYNTIHDELVLCEQNNEVSYLYAFYVLTY